MARQALAKLNYLPCYNVQCWTGLATTTNNANWIWTDGTPFNYHFWSREEPNNPGDENCVQIMLTTCQSETINSWNNVECTLAVQNFVCKKANH